MKQVECEFAEGRMPDRGEKGRGKRFQMTVVKLWCRPIQTGGAFVLFQTNAVFGTWIGR